jgi:hypothetical protein
LAPLAWKNQPFEMLVKMLYWWMYDNFRNLNVIALFKRLHLS